MLQLAYKSTTVTVLCILIPPNSVWKGISTDYQVPTLLFILFRQQIYHYLQANYVQHQSSFSNTRSLSYLHNSSHQYWRNLSSQPTNARNLHQGNKRRFGEYRCHHCGRKWTSAYSWASMGQQCKICHTNVLPCRQEGL